jgi:hypothetical protein
MSCPDPESEHDADHGPSGEGSDGAGVPLESRAKRAIATDPGQDLFDDPALAPDERSSSRGEVEESAEDAEDQDKERGDHHAEGRKNEIADDADPAVPPRPHLAGMRRLLRCIGNGHRESDRMLPCRPQRCGRAQEAAPKSPTRHQPR